MWVFTKYGFFSAVCARQGDGRHGNPVDPDRMMVRARLREHLESLASAFPEELQGVEIVQTASTDYRYRMFVDKPTWSKVMAELVNDVDYDNFKNAAALQHGHSSDYVHALHDVWQVMYGIQGRT